MLKTSSLIFLFSRVIKKLIFLVCLVAHKKASKLVIVYDYY